MFVTNNLATTNADKNTKRQNVLLRIYGCPVKNIVKQHQAVSSKYNVQTFQVVEFYAWLCGAHHS